MSLISKSREAKRFGRKKLALSLLALLGTLLCLCILALVGLGVAQPLLRGDIAGLREGLASWSNSPVLALGGLLLLATLFCLLALCARRARDVGLPGWVAAIAVLAAVCGALVIGAPGVAAVVGVGALLVLLCWPGASGPHR